ncbi:unnamed protein product, partial [Amoebophrya sp. A120]
QINDESPDYATSNRKGLLQHVDGDKEALESKRCLRGGVPTRSSLFFRQPTPPCLVEPEPSDAITISQAPLPASVQPPAPATPRRSRFRSVDEPSSCRKARCLQLSPSPIGEDFAGDDEGTSSSSTKKIQIDSHGNKDGKSNVLGLHIQDRRDENLSSTQVAGLQQELEEEGENLCETFSRTGPRDVETSSSGTLFQSFRPTSSPLSWFALCG